MGTFLLFLLTLFLFLAVLSLHERIKKLEEKDGDS